MAFADRVPDRFAPRRLDPIDGPAYRRTLIAEGRLRPDAPPVRVVVNQPTLAIGPIVLRNEPEPDASTCSD